jgi:hypothetical protein
MPRYVILEHDHPRLHWDLLLEDGDHLRGWRLAEAPRTGGAIAAEAMPDHRMIYLDYEGPVRGGRGEVRRWDAGEFTLHQANESGLCLLLQGRRISAEVALQHQRGQEWLAVFSGSTDA